MQIKNAEGYKSELRKHFSVETIRRIFCERKDDKTFIKIGQMLNPDFIADKDNKHILAWEGKDFLCDFEPGEGMREI